MGDDERSVGSHTSRASLPSLSSKHSGVSPDSNNMALLRLFRTRKERLRVIEHMAAISDEVSPKTLMPEPELLVNSGVNSKWAVAMESTSSRAHDPWICRFNKRVEEMEVVMPNIPKAQLAEIRLKRSGWFNQPTRVGSPPVSKPDKGLATMAFVGEGEGRSLLCFVCCMGVDVRHAIKCEHCPCVSHAACSTSCYFCIDDLAETNRLHQSKHQRTEKIYIELRARLCLQAWIRGACKRRWWIRLRSAVVSIQQAIRLRLFKARTAKEKREALRPFRLRLNHVIVYSSTSATDTPAEVVMAKHRTEHVECSSLPSGLYERIFGCGGGSTTAEAGDLPSIWLAGHRNAPQYNGWEGLPLRTKLEPGSFVLQITVNEAQNNETVFRKIEKKQLYTRPLPPQRGKQIWRVDIPLSSKQVFESGSNTYTVKSGLNYLLFPAVKAMTEIGLTLVQLKEWPKGFIRGQARLNCQEIFSKKKSCIVESQFLSTPSEWINPSPEEGYKLSYLSWRRLCDSHPHGPTTISSVGLVSWTILSHTDESSQQAGWVNLHHGQTVRRQWGVLVDKVLMLYQGQELKPYKICTLSQCSMSVAPLDNLIRLKTASELLYLSAATSSKDHKRWVEKMGMQCKH